MIDANSNRILHNTNYAPNLGCGSFLHRALRAPIVEENYEVVVIDTPGAQGPLLLFGGNVRMAKTVIPSAVGNGPRPGAPDALPAGLRFRRQRRPHSRRRHMIQLRVTDIDLYDRNPRQAPNKCFAEIKESIRTTLIQTPLVVTKRPGSDRYMISTGGNSRLKAKFQRRPRNRSSVKTVCPC